MIFNALPVKEGDSFLLNAKDYCLLVDSGKDPDECIKFITKQNISQIDQFICTHYDEDHVNGLLSLLKSSIKIGEVCLPHIMGKLNETLNDTSNIPIRNFINILNERSELSGETAGNQLVCRLLTNDGIIYDIIDSKIDRYVRHIITTKNDQNIITNAMLLNYSLTPSQQNTVKDIISECKLKKIKIRWFKYVNQYLPKNKISDHMYGLNCRETRNIEPFNSVSEMMLYLTPINIESLVYKFEHEDYPDVLFCADSNFKFLEPGENIKLKENSISTVAHHGSKDNSKTFKRIDGKDLIYVRSDKLNSSRPSKEYISLPNEKYCTICNSETDPNNIRQITLTYNSGWNTSNSKCTCK